jgi:hypothetical protein
MKSQRLAIGLMVLNIFILMSFLFRANSAATPEVAAVLRARAFELVDEQGRVRAEMIVCPRQHTQKMADGTTEYPETVLLRLISSQGGPNVKIAATEDGGVFGCSGKAGYVQILSRGTNLPCVNVVTKDGKERTFKP